MDASNLGFHVEFGSLPNILLALESTSSKAMEGIDSGDHNERLGALHSQIESQDVRTSGVEEELRKCQNSVSDFKKSHIEPLSTMITDTQKSSSDNRARWEALTRRLGLLEDTLVEDRVSSQKLETRLCKLGDDLIGLSHDLEISRSDAGTSKKQIDSLQRELSSLDIRTADISNEMKLERERVNAELLKKFDLLSQTQRNSFATFSDSFKKIFQEPPQAAVLRSMIWSTQRLIADMKLEKVSNRSMSQILLEWSMQATFTKRKKLAAYFMKKGVLSFLRRHVNVWRHATEVDRIVSIFDRKFNHISSAVERKAEAIEVDEKLDVIRKELDTGVSSLESKITRIEKRTNEWDACVSELAALKQCDIPDILSRQKHMESRLTDLDNKQTLVQDRYLDLEKKVKDVQISLESCMHFISEQRRLENERKKIDQAKQVEVRKEPESREVFSDMLLLWSFVKDLQAESRESSLYRSRNDSLHDAHAVQIKELRALVESLKAARPIPALPVIQIHPSPPQTESKRSTPRDIPLPRPRSAVLTRTSSTASGPQIKSQKPEFKGLHARGKGVGP